MGRTAGGGAASPRWVFQLSCQPICRLAGRWPELMLGRFVRSGGDVLVACRSALE